MHIPKTYLSQERIIATDKFIERNHLSLCRSCEEVAQRISSKSKEDFFGFSSEVLIDYAGFEQVKDQLKEDAVKKYESGEKTWSVIGDIKTCAQDFLDYMNFAWGKAEDQRGISASRSVCKLGEWLWLMGRGDLHDEIHRDDLYNPYGAPALISICEKMGITVPESLIEFAKHPCD
jgi:hypothetical protein